LANIPISTEIEAKKIQVPENLT
jgi:hypothetical protein